jgi:GNAT superfamily N-acetyltransferase
LKQDFWTQASKRRSDLNSDSMAEEPGLADKRDGRLEFGTIDAAAFLRRLRQVGSSLEVPGGVKSQYETQLLKGETDVGTWALNACGSPVAALSYGLFPLKIEPDTIGCRIDVVLTEPACRGRGLALVLISSLMVRLAEDHGSRLRSVSVVAAHPAIGRIAERFGFDRMSTNESDIYTLRLSPESMGRVTEEARRALAAPMKNLRKICVDCQRRAWVSPWCREEGPR